MKIILAFALILLLGKTSLAQQTVADRERIRQQKIKKVTELRYLYKNGSYASQGKPWGYLEYDTRGNQIVNGRYNRRGQEYAMYLRLYDQDNRPVKRMYYTNSNADNPKGDVSLVFENYRLDEHGNVTEENGYDTSGNHIVRVSFKRDEDGRPLEREEFFPDDKSKCKTYSYKYREQTEVSVFDLDGRLISKTIISYKHKDGELVEEKHDDINGSQIRRLTHQYRDSRRIETIVFGADDNPVHKKRFVYEFY